MMGGYGNCGLFNTARMTENTRPKRHFLNYLNAPELPLMLGRRHALWLNRTNLFITQLCKIYGDKTVGANSGNL